MSTDRERLRLIFDDAPEHFDRTRPVCPAQVFDDLVALAGLKPGARLLEIGCGTGQATMPLAERGFAVLGVELGPRLAAFSRRKFASFPNVEIIHADFENWDAGDIRFDGIVAFNAFHWIDPAVRYAKSAQLLRDDGALAVIASSIVLPDGADPLWTAMQQDYAAIPNGPAPQPPPHPDAVGDFRDEIAGATFFRNVAARRYSWQVEYTAEEYVTLLSTSSWHRQLAPEERGALFARIRQRIEARRIPTVSLDLLTTLNVARRC